MNNYSNLIIVIIRFFKRKITYIILYTIPKYLKHVEITIFLWMAYTKRALHFAVLFSLKIHAISSFDFLGQKWRTFFCLPVLAYFLKCQPPQAFLQTLIIIILLFL